MGWIRNAANGAFSFILGLFRVVGTSWRVLETLVEARAPREAPPPSASSSTVEEERLRYARDAVEKNFERRNRVIDGLNLALVALFGILFALVCVFIVNMCDFGWVPMAACAAIAVVALRAVAMDAEDIDADEFISDMTDDPVGTLADSIAVFLDRIRAATKIIEWKKNGLILTSVLCSLLTVYAFLVKVDVLPALHLRSEVCPVGTVPTKESSANPPKTIVRPSR